MLSALLLAVFVLIETRSADPLMPMRLFRNRSLVAGMSITFIYMGSFGALPYFLTVLFQTVMGFSALETGLAFIVPSLAIAAGTQLGERLATKLTTRSTLLLGSAIGVAGTVAIGLATTAGYAALVPGLVVSGIGQGIVWTGMWIASASGVAAEEQGVASGMASTTLNIGNAIGLAVLIAIANAGIAGQQGEALRPRHRRRRPASAFMLARTRHRAWRCWWRWPCRGGRAARRCRRRVTEAARLDRRAAAPPIVPGPWRIPRTRAGRSSAWPSRSSSSPTSGRPAASTPGRSASAVAFTYGEPPFYAQIRRDAARLNLRWVQRPVFAPGFREREVDVLSATIAVDDPKALFLELQAAGAPFHQTLRTEPWGARTSIIRDPDGNLVAFAG